MIAGAQKSGTTFLHHCLQRHEAIFFPKRPQELHFFDTQNYDKGLEWYAEHFTDVQSSHTAIGQTAPSYIFVPHTAARIAGALPQVKLIFVLRNPIDRAYSHYWHEFKYGHEILTFEEAILQSLAGTRNNSRRFSYIERGMYAQQLKRYLDVFDKSQMLVLKFEELRDNPAATLNVCCKFLGIEPGGEELLRGASARAKNTARLPRSLRLQRLVAKIGRRRLGLLTKLIDRLNLETVSYPPMASHIRTQLFDVFQDDIQDLARTFELDFSQWR